MNIPYWDRWVQTSYGRTHLIETGNTSGIPLLVFHGENATRRCMLPMAVTDENITDDIYETAKLSITYSKVKTGMPGNVDKALMVKCKAQMLVMAAEKDCLFPAQGVLSRAKSIIEHVDTYLLKDRGHMNILTDGEKQMIIDFLKN